MKIVGVCHPVPKNFAERIYNQNKNVFVSKAQLGKVNPGDKFVIYESRGAKAYTGWADIKSIAKENTRSILKKYGNNLIVTEVEFREYSKNKKEMNVIVFHNFEKFKTPVKPKKFVTVMGKYIDEDEFKKIDENKG